MNQQFGPLLYTISIWALPAIIAITFHEAAHGFAALRSGDDTAWRLGRVTFNPLKHIDPMARFCFRGCCFFYMHRFYLAMRSRSRSTSGRCEIRGATWCGSRRQARP